MGMPVTNHHVWGHVRAWQVCDEFVGLVYIIF